MHERDSRISTPPAEAKEIPQRGDLHFLWHPGTVNVFSGYGLVASKGIKESLVGILMVDRPIPVDPAWLHAIEATFGDYQLVSMTAAGERGIVCQMQIEPDSLSVLRQFPGAQSDAIRTSLEPLLTERPKPVFALRWNEEARVWCSQFSPSIELPSEIREAFERTGHGCLATETNIGVVHVCHAADGDIDGFADKPVLSQWQLIEMSTAPLIRLELVILDRPSHPYLFESFLNVAEEDQASILEQLIHQDELHLAFFGDALEYRFTKTIQQDEQQRQQLHGLVLEAITHWARVPADQRDFDRAKAEFMQRYV